MASALIVKLTKDNYEQEVIKSDIPVIVDFWAQWCGPCRTVAPIMDELAEKYNGKVKIGKVNVDEESEVAAKYRIMSIPTIMVFKGGQIAEKVIGARSKDEFEKMIDKSL